MRKLLPALVLGLAFWPVWVWFAARYSDGSDEPLGVLALLTALLIPVLTERGISEWRSPRRLKRLFVGALLLMSVYLLTYFWAPQAFDGLLAIVCVAMCLSAIFNRKINAGTVGLLVLSLPVVATANFYLGYPLRLLATNASAILLRLSGFAVHSRATELLLGNKVVEVDAPCSGVKMLWFTVYLACALSAFYQFRWWRSLKLVLIGVVAAVLANVVRVNALFVMDATSLFDQFASLEEVMHQAVGVVSFCLGAACVLAAVQRETAAECSAKTERSMTNGNRRPASHLIRLRDTLNHWRCIPKPLRAAFYVLCFFAGIVPLASAMHHPTEVAMAFPGWPNQFSGRPLSEIEISPTNRAFLSGFPGKVGSFTDGRRTILVRWVTKPTRQLHPSCDCYRATGYSIKWLPLHISGDGVRWSRYEATRGTDHLVVSERIHDENGKNWSDVSAWYWATVFERSRAPWWMITIVERSQ